MSLSRLGISVNLPVGDSYELLLIDTPAGYPAGQLFFQFSAPSSTTGISTPRKIDGLQKVAQTFLRMLMTSQGSDVIYPNMGTNFPALALQSNRSGEDTVFVANITTTVGDAANQAKMILNTTGQDPSAQLSAVNVLGITAIYDTLTMMLQIVTLAGVSASVAIPFPQLDLPLSNG